MIGKVWTKTTTITKKKRDGKGKYCKYCTHQFLQLKESGWEGFIERLSFDRNTP